MADSWSEIMTDRLILRPLEEADAVDLMAVFADREVMSGNSIATWFLDVDELLQYIRKECLASPFLDDLPFFVIERQADGKVIGALYFNTVIDGCGEFAYFIAKEAQGCGYMNEIFPRMLDQCFGKWSLNRVTASYSKENKTSAHLLQKFGFHKMSKTTDVILNDHKPHTMITCYQDRTEWLEKRRRNCNEERIGTEI